MSQKIKRWNDYQLLKFVQCMNLVVLPFAIWMFIESVTWWYFFVTAFALIMISKVGHSIGQHRYFSHRSFKTDNQREWLLTLLAILGTTGTTINYCGIHRYHHAHSDTDLDPHSPKKLGFLKAFLGLVDLEKSKAVSAKLIKDLLANQRVVFFHNWYWPIIVVYWAVLVAVDPLLFLFCYVIPCGYVQFVTGTQLSSGHLWGYKNFDLQDHSVNNRLWHWLTLGEGMHNNHHASPAMYDFGYTKNPGEWDFCGWVVRRFFIVDQLPARN